MELKEYISRMRELSEANRILLEEEKKLSSPIISDLSQVERVLGYCREAYGDKPRKNVSRPFLFVMLFFFSPKTLSGGKMVSGLRDKLAECLDTTASNISHYTANLMFYYVMYKDFANEVNNLFTYVYARLKENQ